MENRLPRENRVSIELTPEALTKCEDAIKTLKTELEPYLIALTSTERRDIPKMSDKTYAFVKKIITYTDENPQFLPYFMDADELKTDFNAVSQLNKIFTPLNQLTSLLDDTIKQSGGEAYLTGLAYYNSVKQANKMDIPDAKPIYDDLKKRFPQTGRPPRQKDPELEQIE